MNPSLASQQVVTAMPHAASRRIVPGTATSFRYDIYSNAHKALRLALGEALAAAGRVDPHDDNDVATLAERIRSLLQFCRTHLDKEENFVHPAIEARRPGAAAATQDDHREHLAAFEQLEADLRTLEAARNDRRDAAAMQLYRRLALFVADNLVHMHAEETDNNAALWAAYSNDELHSLEQRLVASIPQDMLQLALRSMMPALNPAERATMVLEMRDRVPAPAFTAFLANVQGYLTEAEWRKLTRALAV